MIGLMKMMMLKYFIFLMVMSFYCYLLFWVVEWVFFVLFVLFLLYLVFLGFFGYLILVYKDSDI